MQFIGGSNRLNLTAIASFEITPIAILGTMRANIPGASLAIERSTSMDDCREVSAASRLGFILSRLRIGQFSSGSNSGF
jgi:hypothetical protein